VLLTYPCRLAATTLVLDIESSDIGAIAINRSRQNV
jgi:hypothetical protein